MRRGSGGLQHGHQQVLEHVNLARPVGRQRPGDPFLRGHAGHDVERHVAQQIDDAAHLFLIGRREAVDGVRMRRHAVVQGLGQRDVVDVEGVGVHAGQVVDDFDQRPVPHVIQKRLLQGKFGRGVERRLRRMHEPHHVAEL
ncbi:hypothetical protein LRS10_02040 [Phenylobacterium sp. J426]|uniref:hypothetical protein n=1 Tax=Phenylobacterium sp. J426 TaxID=2898439 RepID=UPI0021519624|nr:hypothetical protein [Phenylobacterium sp. J426]MCR5873082.1 hypothetical protein [Phenylobacterium sp. J426]